MGKYLLENYEIYKQYKIRPKPLNEDLKNRGRGQFNIVNINWADFEVARGNYQVNKLFTLINRADNPVLTIGPDCPSWVTDNESDYFASFIRQVGSCLKDNHKLEGVIVTSEKSFVQVWDAYIDAFSDFILFVDINNKDLINYFNIHKKDFGLIIRCSENNWLDACEKLAEEHLQDVWKSNPVLLQIEENCVGTNISKQAAFWHASMANLKMDIGYRIELRRLTYPKTVSTNGALPLRFWFVNTGSAPCYHEFNMYLRLKNENNIYDIPLNVNSRSWLIGDIIHNEIAKLPDMVPGRYKVLVGIFFKDNTPMNLNINNDVENGFYDLGLIDVDAVCRDEYFHIWDNYYPEGYYPLEDPQSPVKN